MSAYRVEEDTIAKSSCAVYGVQGVKSLQDALCCEPVGYKPTELVAVDRLTGNVSHVTLDHVTIAECRARYVAD